MESDNISDLTEEEGYMQNLQNIDGGDLKVK